AGAARARHGGGNRDVRALGRPAAVRRRHERDGRVRDGQGGPPPRGHRDGPRCRPAHHRPGREPRGARGALPRRGRRAARGRGSGVAQLARHHRRPHVGARRPELLAPPVAVRGRGEPRAGRPALRGALEHLLLAVPRATGGRLGRVADAVERVEQDVAGRRVGGEDVEGAEHGRAVALLHVVLDEQAAVEGPLAGRPRGGGPALGPRRGADLLPPGELADEEPQSVEGHAETPWRMDPAPLLDLTVYLLSRVGRLGKHALDDRLAERGLPLRHMAVLAALADSGAASQLALARAVRLDPSDTTTTLDELQRRGLVERSVDPADRRRRVVSLTDRGREQLDEMCALADEVAAELLAPLEPTERAALHDALGRVLRARA